MCDPLNYGLGRRLEAYCEILELEISVAIHKNIEEAMRWFDE